VKFNVKEAQLAWERRHPVWGERVLVLRGELYDCESERRTARYGKPACEVYKETAKNLRLMLAAEGAEA
jgi:hypothetical protein